MLTPDFDRFREYWGQYDSVPMGRTLLADQETPVTLFAKMSRNGTHPFLLESVEGSEQRARYSFVGCDPRERISLCHAGIGLPPKAWRQDLATGGSEPVPDFFAALEQLSHDRGSPCLAGLPPFTGGALGYVSYEAVSLMEPVDLLEDLPAGTLLACFHVYDTVFAFDHLRHTLTLTTNVRGNFDAQAAYQRGRATLERSSRLLEVRSDTDPMPYPEAFGDQAAAATARSGFAREEFENAVRKTKEHILAGDIFQAVLSRRLECPLEGRSTLDIYRILRLLNPSPYMYLIEMGDVTILGTSPEALVRVTDKTAEVMPIAGTRKRGTDAAEDRELERELLADPKENAEHVMLVDLARNDLGRISAYGTVRVADFRRVERYSHVMHLVSKVEGTVRDGLSPLTVFRACFPAGTVSGAPKIRAMQIIHELEPVPRGIYAGAIAYLSFSGNLDSCIAIRTMLVRDGTAHIQSGAGIVADSVPESEFLETIGKASALVSALAAAPRGRS